MPATALDPVTALVLVDLQAGVVSPSTVDPVEEVVRYAGRLAQAFRRDRLPVVLVATAGTAPGRTQLARGAIRFPPGALEIVPGLDPQPDATDAYLALLAQGRLVR